MFTFNVSWDKLVSSGTQVKLQIILNPEYLPDYLSVSYDYYIFEHASLRYGISWKGAVKCLSKFDIRISYVFVRLILPVFCFEAFCCTKNVECKWKKLNMNDHNGKIRLFMKLTFKL